MAVYTHLSNSEISEILAHYDIGELVSAQAIEEGIDNSNYLLTTSQDKFILTLYEKRLVEEEIPFYLKLMSHMQANGVACPSTLIRKDGALLSQAKGRPVSITTFLQGKALPIIEPKHLSEVGTLLARMHHATNDFPETLINRLAPNRLSPLYDKVKGRLDEFGAGLSQQIADEIKSFQCWPDLDLPRGIVHADVFPDNVFFINDKVGGVIDFYFACEDYYSYDLAVTLNAWCFDGEHKTEFNEEKAAQLLRAYNQKRPLTDAEWGTLSLLARCDALSCTLTRARDWFFQVEGAVVKPHDPREYVAKWQFHKEPKDYKNYL